MTPSAGRTLQRLRALCLARPETSETSSWGHPNSTAGKKTFLWADGTIDWNAVEQLVDRSYRVVAPKRIGVRRVRLQR